MATRKKRDDKKDDLPIEGSVLNRLINEQNTKLEEEENQGEVVAVFCGMKRSGKTSIIDRFINPAKDDKDEPRPTVALDYRFARYSGETPDGQGKKTVAHIYELGGDENNQDLASIPTSAMHMGSFVLCICIDLSQPGSCAASLDQWLTQMQQQVTESLEAFGKESAGTLKRVEALRQAKQDIFEEHPDQGKCKPFPVPLVIFGTKSDLMLAELESEKRKALCKGIRYIAHAAGAHLVFTSNKDKPSMNSMRGLLRQLIFGAPAAKGGLAEQLDPGKPISVAAGKDKTENIGLPPNASDSKGEKAWQQHLAHLFPDLSPSGKRGGARQLSEADQVAEDIPKYSEAAVDGMVEQRVEELQQYRKQVERNQRLASEGLDMKAGAFPQ